MTSPLVSVLMPAYDASRFLPEAIDSILRQTCSDLELVVVDDGSADDTADILERYRRRDGRVRLCRQPHSGVAAALNRAIELARGPYLARMDADDVSLPRRLATQVAFLDANPEVGICGTRVRTIGWKPSRISRPCTDDAAIRCQLLFANAFAHSSVMMRRASFRDGGPRYDPAYTEAQDYELWVRSASSMRLANVPEVLHEYRVHLDQVSRRRAGETLEPVSRIHRSQLHGLGIDASPDELSLHAAIALLQFRPTRESLLRAEVWLRRLRAANDAVRQYPEPAFSRLVAERWYQLYLHSARLGPWAWRTFRRSPLAEGTPASVAGALRELAARRRRRLVSIACSLAGLRGR